MQIEQQFNDLLLHSDIERGRRLIGDQQTRLASERHRDHRPLPLATGKLMRIRMKAPCSVTDLGQLKQLNRTIDRLGAHQAFMQLQHFANLLADTKQRIKRGHRLLKNHRDLTAANRAHFAIG